MNATIRLLFFLLLLVAAPLAQAQQITYRDTEGKPSGQMTVLDPGTTPHTEEGLSNLETIEQIGDIVGKPNKLQAILGTIVNGQPPPSRMGSIINTSMTGQPNPSASKQRQLTNWNDKVLNPSVLEGAAHIRQGISSHGEFGGAVEGRPTCDFLYLFYAKTGKDITTNSLYETCVLDERSFKLMGGSLPGLDGKKPRSLVNSEDGINTSTPQGRVDAVEKYAPLVKERQRVYRSIDWFYIRPAGYKNLVATHYNPDTQMLTVALRFNGGPGILQVYGPEFEKNNPPRPEIKLSGTPMFVVHKRVPPEVGMEFVDAAMRVGRDNAMDKVVFHIVDIEDGAVKKIQIKVDSIELGWLRPEQGDPRSQHTRKLYRVMRFYSDGK